MTETVTENYSELPNKLVNARKALKLDVETVASKLNLSEDKIIKLESDSVELTSLSTFERGYLRNYASFLDVDISQYEQFFPEGSTVGSELQSVERFSYKTTKAFKETIWAKLLKFVLVAAIVVGLLVLFASTLAQSDWQAVLEQLLQ